MRLIESEVFIESQDWKDMLEKIEFKGRVCYKSEEKITNDSITKFITNLLNNGHLSVLEHQLISVKFVCDRGISHEIVRHRVASYSQESTRYCNYGRNGGIGVVKPFFFEEDEIKNHIWLSAMEACERRYLELLRFGASPQEARSVLPNSLKTELWVTYNLREWLHFFSLRAAKPAHPQMRQLVIPLLLAFKEILPSIFEHVSYDEDFPKENYSKVTFI